MSMSQKDYELIAATLKRSRNYVSEALGIDGTVAIDYTILELAHKLEAHHKGYPFKRDLFLKAAGYGD